MPEIQQTLEHGFYMQASGLDLGFYKCFWLILYREMYALLEYLVAYACSPVHQTVMVTLLVVLNVVYSIATYTTVTIQRSL